MQINIGNEEQKSGVSLNNLKELYELSVKDFNLNVIGLMCLPPENKDPKEIVIDEFIGQSIPICLYEIAHDETKEINEVLKFYFIM